MAVKVHKPEFTVKVIKLVRRSGEGVAERFSGAEREFDLTPFLSEGGAVKVVKGVADPAGGFTIAIADQPDRSILDSIYARVEAMDMVEIRGSREPHKRPGQPLPLLMRGFVNNIRRTEAIGAEGAPQRFVTIQGQDAGKLFLIFRLFWEAIYAEGNNPYLDVYRLQAATGIEAAFLPVGEAMRQLVERVMNPRIAQLAAYADRAVPPLRYRGSVRQGLVSPNLIAPFQGPYWGLVETFCDRPWNEAFVEDEEEGPVLIFRPCPFKNISGGFIMPGAADPGTIELDADQVVSLDLGRGDERVANFFYVPPGASMLDASQAVTVASIASGEPFDTNYGNNKPELYGLRKMEAQSQLLPESIGSLPAQLPAAEAQRASADIVQWHIQRARHLRDMNRDNSVLEEGSATVQGAETIKAGRFLRLTRGDLVAEFYVPKVVHNIAPLDGWTAQVSLIRGMGFLERIRMTGSPFWKEGRRGPYSA